MYLFPFAEVLISFFLSSYFNCYSVVWDFFEWEAGGATADCVSSFSHYSLIPLFPPTLAISLFLAKKMVISITNTPEKLD